MEVSTEYTRTKAAGFAKCMEFNTRGHLPRSAYEVSLPKLELNIVSKRNSVLSRYSDIKSREVALAALSFLLIFLKKMRVEF